MHIQGNSYCRGRVRTYSVVDDKWLKPSKFKPNLVVNEWATIVARLLSQGSAAYRISGMYLEFENVAAPEDPVSIPAQDRTRDITYYADLSTNPDRDYLRVPLTAVQTLSSGEGFTNNQLLFFARSQGVQGVHGKTFSSLSNSKIFGAALVAMPDQGDSSQDLIFSSFYYEEEDQQQKLSTSQIGLEWEITFN